MKSLLAKCALCIALTSACRTDPEPAPPDKPKATRPAADKGKKTPKASEKTPKASEKPETVVFVVMDTVRAASTSLCGYERPTTPFLEKMRDELGAVWSCDAYSPASWTMPSHTSYFTGQGIPDHGHDRLGVKLPQDTAPLLAEQMSAKGYQTLMFAANPALSKSGLRRGFDHVRIAKDMQQFRRPKFADELEGELKKTQKGKPLFLFVNLIDAHDPYPAIPDDVEWVDAQKEMTLNVRSDEADGHYHQYLRGEMDEELGEKYVTALRNGYDYGVSMEDDNVRAVVRLLKKIGRLPGPMRMIVTADHGEFFGEHGLLRHAAYVYEPVVKVPFLYMDNSPDASPVQLPQPMSATTAFYLARDGALPSPALPVTSWSRRMDDRPVKPGENMTSSWQEDGSKLLWWDGKTMRFDLTDDPGEEQPSEIQPDAEFTSQVETYKAHLTSTKDVELDPETVESLRELGYLQ